MAAHYPSAWLYLPALHDKGEPESLKKERALTWYPFAWIYAIF